MRTLDPRQKLLVAGLLLALLAGAAVWAAGGAAAGARATLLVTGLGGLLLWMRRRQAASTLAAPIARLAVVERAGLSPRCSVALVRADGREYLIAYGDGFAQIHPTAGATVAFGRRSVRRRGSSRKSGVRR